VACITLAFIVRHLTWGFGCGAAATANGEMRAACVPGLRGRGTGCTLRAIAIPE
jgi:hypothetical protein